MRLFLSMVGKFLFLSLLWVIFCIPIITIFSATAAMFGVVREWTLKNDIPLFSTYLSFFKSNFKNSLIIECIWLFLGAILVFDLMFLSHASQVLQMVLYIVTIIVSLIFSFTSVYLFPVMVHFETSLIGIMRNSLLLGMGHFVRSIVILLFILTTLFFVYIFPPLIFILASPLAYLIYRLCHRSFIPIAAVHSLDQRQLLYREEM